MKSRVKSNNKSYKEVIEEFLKEVCQSNSMNIRKIDALTYLSQNNFIKQLATKKDPLCIQAKKYVNDYIEKELNTLLQEHINKSIENKKTELEVLEEMKQSNFLKDILNIQICSKVDDNNKEELTIIKKKLQNSLNTFVNSKLQSINENSINIKINNCELSEEDMFFNTVRKHTNNFKFLASNATQYCAQTGKRNINKFDNTNDYFKFLEIQTSINNVMLKNKKDEIAAINQLLSSQDKQDSTVSKILIARKNVIEKENDKGER